VEHVTLLENVKNTHKILIGEPERQRRKSKTRVGEYKISVKGWENPDRIHLA
jgi:hypothetical protein